MEKIHFLLYTFIFSCFFYGCKNHNESNKYLLVNNLELKIVFIDNDSLKIQIQPRHQKSWVNSGSGRSPS